MLNFLAAIKVYLCMVPCDMRPFDGLSMMTEYIIRCDPFSGHLLVFRNLRSDRVKILCMVRIYLVLELLRLKKFD